MSFTNGTGLALFPTEWIRQCIATYTKDHGKVPRLLVLAEDDLLDYKLNLSINDVMKLDIQFTSAPYLKPGEIDLAMGVKDPWTWDTKGKQA